MGDVFLFSFFYFFLFFWWGVGCSFTLLTDGFGCTLGSTAAGLEVLDEGGGMKDLYMEALRVTAFRTSRLDDPKE